MKIFLTSFNFYWTVFPIFSFFLKIWTFSFKFEHFFRNFNVILGSKICGYGFGFSSIFDEIFRRFKQKFTRVAWEAFEASSILANSIRCLTLSIPFFLWKLKYLNFCIFFLIMVFWDAFRILFFISLTKNIKKIYTPPPVYKDNNFLGQQLHFFCQTGQQLLDNTYFLGKKLDNTKIVVLIYGGVYIRTFTTWLLSLDL